MSGSAKPPVATLAGVTLPGSARPVAAQALPDHVTVLRRATEGDAWTRMPAQAGMALREGDVIRLRGDAFGALGARAFSLGGPAFGGGQAPPDHVHLAAHEATHVAQQSPPRVTEVNEAEAEAIERGAVAPEELVPHRAR